MGIKTKRKEKLMDWLEKNIFDIIGEDLNIPSYKELKFKFGGVKLTIFKAIDTEGNPYVRCLDSEKYWQKHG